MRSMRISPGMLEYVEMTAQNDRADVELVVKCFNELSKALEIMYLKPESFLDFHDELSDMLNKAWDKHDDLIGSEPFPLMRG